MRVSRNLADRPTGWADSGRDRADDIDGRLTVVIGVQLDDRTGVEDQAEQCGGNQCRDPDRHTIVSKEVSVADYGQNLVIRVFFNRQNIDSDQGWRR